MTPKQAGRIPRIEHPSEEGVATACVELMPTSPGDQPVAPPKAVALGPVLGSVAASGISKSLSHSELLGVSPPRVLDGTPARGIHLQQPSARPTRQHSPLSENAMASCNTSGLRLGNAGAVAGSGTQQTLRGLVSRRPTSPPVARATAISPSVSNSPFTGVTPWNNAFSTLAPNCVPQVASVGASIATVAGTGNVPGSPNAISSRPVHALHSGTSLVNGEVPLAMTTAQNIALALGTNGTAPPRSPRQPTALGMTAPGTNVSQRVGQISPLGPSITSTPASSTSGIATTTSYMSSFSPIGRTPYQSVPGVQPLGSQTIVTAAPQVANTAVSTTLTHVVMRRNFELTPPLASGPGGSIGAWPGLRDQTPAVLRPTGASTMRSHGTATSPITSNIAQPMSSVASIGTGGATTTITHAVASGSGTPLPPFPGQASPRALFGRSSRDALSPIAQGT